jgi:hypothetical protein
MNRKIAVIAGVVALFGAALPAASSEMLVELRCYRPQQGYGTCEVPIPTDPASEKYNTDVVNITWQNGGISRIQFPENAMPLAWSSQENQWLSATTWGLCANEKCLYFSDPDWPPQSAEPATLNCLHPTLGENTCLVERVFETKGLRIHWPDNSIDHVNFSSKSEITVWSTHQNAWVEITNAGMCVNRECFFLDSNFFAYFDGD